MKLPFFPSSNNQFEEIEEEKITLNPEPVSQTYNIEFKKFLQKQMPANFEPKFHRARPFIVTSFIAWPAFWLYKGLEWGRLCPDIKIKSYIQRTFLQAKAMQVAILATGVLYALYDPRKDKNPKKKDDSNGKKKPHGNKK